MAVRGESGMFLRGKGLLVCYVGPLGVDAAALAKPRVCGRPHLHSEAFPSNVSVPKMWR